MVISANCQSNLAELLSLWPTGMGMAFTYLLETAATENQLINSCFLEAIGHNGLGMLTIADGGLFDSKSMT